MHQGEAKEHDDGRGHAPQRVAHGGVAHGGALLGAEEESGLRGALAVRDGVS